MFSTDLKASIKAAAAFAHPLFVQNKWIYGVGASAGIPTVEDLESCIRELIDELERDENASFMSTGRFTVYRTVPAGYVIGLDVVEYIYNGSEL